ncbi:hypothetical protein B0T19DRAFT_478497 [Cercophora scortea]|uniref:DUF7708 domain-containing protein n=1 Tax=Cercophora scortea TaxID=314031 RepID=A0AAE0M6M5_9PEZI|nr:hypothetical protein B0T19DRAFT_478497 [Cercophora scortea]
METGDDGTKTKWQQSWKDWFQTPKAEDAKTILEKGRKQCADQSAVTGPVATELRRVTANHGSKASESPATETDPPTDLEPLTLEQLRGYVSLDVSTLSNEAISWQEKRRTGWRKVTTGISQFVQDFDTFLSRFSGIVEIVNMADSQYGGAATLVLSVFFMTVKLKAANDNSIQSCMRTIANRLPDLDIYYRIFADEVLATMLSNAYLDIVIFAQTATAYFQGHGLARFIKGIAHPKSFQDREDGLGKTFGEVRIRCNALVAQRIDQLAHDNEDLQKKVDNLGKQLEEAQSRHDDETRRVIFNRQYSEPKHTRQEKQAKLRRLLDGALFSTYDDAKSVLTLDMLKQCPEYKTWWEKSGSSMLVLHGNNNFDYSAVPQSWLSLAPLDLALELQALASSPAPSNMKAAVAYFNCDSDQDPITLNQDSDPTSPAKPEQVLYNVTEQLLEQQARVMRKMSDVDDIAHRLKRIKSDQEHREGAEHVTSTAMIDDSCQNIRQILQRCQAPLYIVIDRPELCKGCSTWTFVKSLLGLVEEAAAAATLKVLLVVKTHCWDIESWREVVDEETLRSNKLVILRRDQVDCD